MRLIDSDDFFARMENDTDLCAEMETGGLKALKKYLDMQPTAYDIEKVVEELERYPLGNLGCQELDEIIEIVKQGGVSDDVCEWKQDDMCDTVYKVCGGCFTSEYQKDFKYCPYCGKKIKVVE